MKRKQTAFRLPPKTETQLDEYKDVLTFDRGYKQSRAQSLIAMVQFAYEHMKVKELYARTRKSIARTSSNGSTQEKSNKTRRKTQQNKVSTNDETRETQGE